MGEIILRPSELPNLLERGPGLERNHPAASDGELIGRHLNEWASEHLGKFLTGARAVARLRSRT